MRLCKYHLIKYGKEFLVKSCKPQAKENLLIANQAKRLINSYGQFDMRMIRPQNQSPFDMAFTINNKSLSGKEEEEHVRA